MSARRQPSRRMAGRRPQRIGIFGGTFDPIHIAHLRCAEEAREALGLDRVLFVPAATPPHKMQRAVAAAGDRLRMLQLAIAGNPAFRASSLEIDRRGRSYSVDTLRALRKRLPEGTQLVFLLGTDSFREIGTWKEYAALFTLAHLAVLSRPPHRITNPRSLLPVAVRRQFCYVDERKTLLHESGNRILFLSVTPLDISASAIRHRVRCGQSIRYLVSPAVAQYILRNRLYVRGRKTSWS